jgi:Bacterial EndoU nuclease
MSVRSLASWLAIGLLGVAICRPAMAFEPIEGSFMATASCEAFTSLRKRSNPGEVRLEAGTDYRAVGLNRPDGPWVQLDLPDASPRQRWVERACGELAGVAAPAKGGSQAGFLPFFDEEDGGRLDPAPPPPPLLPLDAAVLDVCGDWGSRPGPREFRAMLDGEEVALQVLAVFEALEHRVDGRELELEAFKDRLTEVWFEEDGFTHVFCGEPGHEGIGGLHYRARYLELQEAGLAGRLEEPACRAEIAPPVYTLGVRYRLADGGMGEDCPKGYAYDLDATGLLIEATEAFAAARQQNARAEACLGEVRQGEEDEGYLAVLVFSQAGIRTFYPDASPACDGGGEPQSCLCGPGDG